MILLGWLWLLAHWTKPQLDNVHGYSSQHISAERKGCRDFAVWLLQMIGLECIRWDSSNTAVLPAVW